MKSLFYALFFISTMAVISFASSVTVTTITSQSKYGLLTYVYFETASGPSSSTPDPNTAPIPSGGSGSYSVSRGSSAYLWSPQFTSGTALSSGTWVLDLWASANSSGSLQVSIHVTSSAGTTQSTIVSSASTPTIETSKTQVVMSFAGSAVSVPAGGYLEVVMLAPPGNENPESFTIYWGTGQQTNFQVPYRILS